MTMTPTDAQILARLTPSPYLTVCYALPLGAQKICASVGKATSNTSHECTSSRVHQW